VTWGPLLVFMGTHGWLAPAMFFRLKYKVNAHAKANTDQNCSFEKAKIIIVPLVFLDADSMLTSFDTTRRNADGER
jgi:hypothetical protein